MAVLRAIGVGLALLLLLSLSSVAGAEPTAAEKQTARELVFSGRDKRESGDAAGAVEDHRAAHALMGVPTTGYELGRSQEAAGLLVEALDTLLSVGRMPVQPREVRAYRAARDDAKKLADEIAERVPGIRLSLAGDDVEEATVTVDGVEVVSAALGAPIKLNPGSHNVVARGPGGGEAEQTVSLAEGATVDVSLTIVAPVDDSTLEEAEPATNPIVYVGFGVGAVGFVVGSITGALAASKFADVAPQCPNNRCPPEVHDALDSGQSLGTVSSVAFIVGSVGIAAGVTALFFPIDGATDDEPHDAWLRLGPASMNLVGRF